MQDAEHLAEVDTTAFGRSNPFIGSSEVPHSDPPPYESVVMHDGGVCPNTLETPLVKLCCKSW